MYTGLFINNSGYPGGEMLWLMMLLGFSINQEWIQGWNEVGRH